MDAQALGQPRAVPWRRVLLSLAALTALALIAGALAAFFWLRGYQSLGRGATSGSNPGSREKSIVTKPGRSWRIWINFYVS